MLRDRIGQLIADAEEQQEEREEQPPPGTLPINRPRRPSMPEGLLGFDPAIFEERKSSMEKYRRTHLARKTAWMTNLADLTSRGEQIFTLTVDDLIKLDLLIL
jgi:hypothetical protein